MSIKEKDIKLLWGRAGGRCSFESCNRKLCEDKAHATESFPLGEQAHIVAEEMDGPRGRSILTAVERNSYPNLILLCPTHHTVIDKNPEDFPVEKLFLIKRNHELFIERTTSEAADMKLKTADVVYASLIDHAVESCRMKTWHNWVGWVTATQQRWDEASVEAIRGFRRAVFAAVWPGTNPELERSLQTLSILLDALATRFMEHAELHDERYMGVRFYKEGDYDSARYDRLLKHYNQWIEDCDELAIDATKAANWFADVVRRDINPMFFACEGRFLLSFQVQLAFRTSLPEYTLLERQSLPDSLNERLQSILSRESFGHRNPG